MRIGILITSIGKFGQNGFYNAQEMGLAKALDKIVDEVKVYKLVPLDQEKREEKIEGCKNSVIFLIPARSLGNNGRLRVDILDASLDALVYFSDTQFAVPKAYAWAERNGVQFFPYIGVIESHSTNKIKKLIVDRRFKKNLAVYQKCHCLVKTPAVEQSLETLGVKRISLMPVGLDLELLKCDYKKQSIDALKVKYGYAREDKILLFVGRLCEEKQPIRLIEIFAALSKENDAYQLLIVGAGELEEEVEKKIEACKVKEKVRRIARIPNSDIWELYCMSDSFINLNQQEIFGMAILEAMYYGCKVVAWKAPGPELIIENGVSGWLVESNQEVIDKVTDQKEVSGAAHKRIVNTFTWERPAKLVGKIAMADKKQRILMVHNYYQIAGGEDTVVANEKRMLEEHGHQVFLYSRNNSELKKMGKMQKLLLPFAAIFNVRTYQEIKCLIRKEQIDIVHVHNTLSLISPSVYYAAFACKKPVVQTLHNFRLLCPNAVFSRNGRICEECVEKGLKCSVRYGCYRNSRAQSFVVAAILKFHRGLGTYKRLFYICLTEFNREKLLLLNRDGKKRILEDRVFIKPNFVPEVSVRTAQKKEQYIYVGRLEYLKGIRVLLEAWREFPEKELILCGDGSEEDWVRKYLDIHYMDQVKVLGRRTHEEVLCLMAESRALILPTMCYEGQPTVIMESYAAGTPVIVSDIGNAGSMVKHGVTGLKFCCGSVEALRKAVIQMEEKKDWNTKAFYESLYTEEKNYRLLKNIYETAEKRDYFGKK